MGSRCCAAVIFFSPICTACSCHKSNLCLKTVLTCLQAQQVDISGARGSGTVCVAAMFCLAAFTVGVICALSPF